MFDETQHLVAWNGKFQEIYDLPDALLKPSIGVASTFAGDIQPVHEVAISGCGTIADHFPIGTDRSG